MPIKFSKYDNVLIVERNKIVFAYNIRYVLEVNETLIVLLEIPNNIMYLNNVFGINENGEKKWRIQSVEDVFSINNQLPFENLMVNGADVFVSDFYGRRFSFNPTNGEILSSDIVR